MRWYEWAAGAAVIALLIAGMVYLARRYASRPRPVSRETQEEITRLALAPGEEIRHSWDQS